MSIIKATPTEQMQEIKRGIFEIIPEDELVKKITKSYESQKPMIIKFGADPSRPDIHLGHTVVLQKLKLLQDLGHQVYFLIGDYTAQIGDPTGKNKTRPILTEEEVKKNAETYKEQVGKILDMDKTKVVFNKDWLGKFSGLDMINLMTKATIGAILKREDFSNRFSKEEAIYFHECVYPLLQGYDSVYLKADLELGGTDQTFNLMMGRHLQHAYGQEAQAILTMPLIEGLDGVNKMSKSMDNYISLTDSATDMFGKLMSISDELMKKYYTLLSRKSAFEIQAIINSLNDQSLHPMIGKKNLAQMITSYYHGEVSAKDERDKFEARFSKKEIPDDILVLERQPGIISLLEIFIEQGFIKSKSDGRRLIQQKALKVNQETYEKEALELQTKHEYIIKLGKLRMLKISVL
jgi:tyrosyl-tRNA synthetase